MMKRFLVTGGAGFIGSAVARHLIAHTDHHVLVVDKLTYAGNRSSLAEVERSPKFQFLHADICDNDSIEEAVLRFDPDVILHLAAESHVDRSIDSPNDFVQTNVVGTVVLLQVALRHWKRREGLSRGDFRFHHVSTDEVFGSLGESDFFTERTPYQPRSPYSASKAGSDHFVQAWHHTYGLPIVLTNCSNNYGPYQFPEKLIPLMILNALEGKRLPVYGGGQNIRDWLFVEDHVRALLLVAERGRIGQSYNIGGNNELSNIAVVRSICAILDDMVPDNRIGPRESLISFVDDRPGHDFRYAIDASKMREELGWEPQVTFQAGLRRTVEWYLKNTHWWEEIRSGRYRGERLGKAGG